MEINWLSEAGSIREELTGLRRTLHRCPETGNREERTAEIIEEYLRSCGIKPRRVVGTGVTAEVSGALPGKTAALRADIDALPVTEETGVPYASETPGRMHACGHDVHTAAALGAAKLLNEHRGALRGTVRFLFQPDEEGDGGARRMMEAGCLDGVSAVFGAHVSPELPSGAVGVRGGKLYAASDTFDVTVYGRSAHGAQPEKGIDALLAAAEMVLALRRLPELFPDERSVVTAGTLHAGRLRSIICAEASFTGIIRTLGPENRREMRERVRETLEEIGARTGARVELTLRESYPGIVNDEALTAFVERTAAALFGRGRVRTIESPTLATEDFGFFAEKAPIAFYHIGAGCEYPLHNSRFLPDEESVITAAALHAAVLDAYLAK